MTASIPLFFRVALFGITIFSAEVHAHASSQGFVLLLPTDTYTLVGWLVVLLTALALVLLPARSAHWLLGSKRLTDLKRPPLSITISLASTLILFALLAIGFTGTRDPLENLLPLMMWTGFWIALVLLHGFSGNLWHWINPWAGIHALLRAFLNRLNPRRTNSANSELSSGADAYPDTNTPANVWPACLGLLLFSAFVLSDPAPDDPERLARFITLYWFGTLLLGLLLGDQRWRQRGEFFTVLFRAYAWLAPLARQGTELRFGMPGWRASQIAHSPVATTSMACFVLILLGTGSFDGLNETFWWLSRIGVNPLEFPGRSAVILQTVTGLLLLNVLLIAVFTFVVWLGHRLALRKSPHEVSFSEAFNAFAISLLPIAFAYHVAHYLPTLLVNGQYLAIALGDPLSRGDNLLGLGNHHVTTGFFNTLHTVRWILLTQVGAVVIGHVLAVLLAHASAVELYGSRRQAALGLLPLTILMVLYTFLGLWLLATARGA